jgi:hypothetical protein
MTTVFTSFLRCSHHFSGVHIDSVPIILLQCVCVFYYCRTYYKAVRVGGGGEWSTYQVFFFKKPVISFRRHEPLPVPSEKEEAGSRDRCRGGASSTAQRCGSSHPLPCVPLAAVPFSLIIPRHLFTVPHYTSIHQHIGLTT